MPTCVSFSAPKVQRVKSIRKLLLQSTTLDQPNRAGLSISEKFESPDVFNYCIVRLNNKRAMMALDRLPELRR